MPIDFEESYTLGILVSTISDLCKERGITIKSLEKDLKFGNGTIRRWNTSKPAISAVVRVACYFNVSVDYLLGMSPYRNQETKNLTVQDIGLSERTTEALVELSKSEDSFDAKKIEAINLLLEDDGIRDWGSYLLQSVTDYLFAPETPHRITQLSLDDCRQPFFEYADVLLDRLLLDRVIKSLEKARNQYRHPEARSEMCEPLRERVLEIERERKKMYGKSEIEDN